MSKTRRSYSAEFKEQAVLLVVEQNYSIAEAARQLGIGQNLLRNWKAKYLDQGDQAFPGNGNRSSQDAELHRLRQENHRLRQEREVLTKALGYFSSPPI